MVNSETRDTFGAEKRVEFKVTLVGYGHSVQEAWEDAIESFQNDPGAPDDEDYKVTEERCILRRRIIDNRKAN